MPVKNTSKLEKNITTKKNVKGKQNTSKKNTAVIAKKAVAQVKRETVPAKGNKAGSAQDKSGEKLLAIKKKLMQQREALLAEAELALNTLPGQTIFPDLGDQVSAEIDRNFMLRLRGREQKFLLKIDEALDKIDSNTFGICETCGQGIDIKRLFARPVTTMCITCKTEQEEEEKMRRDR